MSWRARWLWKVLKDRVTKWKLLIVNELKTRLMFDNYRPQDDKTPKLLFTQEVLINVRILFREAGHCLCGLAAHVLWGLKLAPHSVHILATPLQMSPDNRWRCRGITLGQWQPSLSSHMHIHTWLTHHFPISSEESLSLQSLLFVHGILTKNLWGFCMWRHHVCKL